MRYDFELFIRYIGNLIHNFRIDKYSLLKIYIEKL